MNLMFNWETDKYTILLRFFWKVVVIFDPKIVASEYSKRPDLISMGLIELDYPVDICPRCHNSFYDVNYGELRRKISILKGPYTRYSKRDDELFFDLTEKYYECVSCGQEVSVLDIQTLIANLSARLPPEDARRFTMKMMAKYRMNPESIKDAMPILLDDFELSKDEPCVF